MPQENITEQNILSEKIFSCCQDWRQRVLKAFKNLMEVIRENRVWLLYQLSVTPSSNLCHAEKHREENTIIHYSK